MLRPNEIAAITGRRDGVMASIAALDVITIEDARAVYGNYVADIGALLAALEEAAHDRDMYLQLANEWKSFCGTLYESLERMEGRFQQEMQLRLAVERGADGFSDEVAKIAAGLRERGADGRAAAVV
jgi:hypothetical protein